jgi:hypothetical protein
MTEDRFHAETTVVLLNRPVDKQLVLVHRRSSPWIGIRDAFPAVKHLAETWAFAVVVRRTGYILVVGRGLRVAASAVA